jgi:feruloyl-CoA synthase
MPQPDIAPFRPLPFIARDIEIDRRADGTLYLQSRIALAPVAAHVPAIFAQTAARHPERPWLQQRRGASRGWQVLRYGQAQRDIRAMAEALLQLDAAGRSVMVLSGNSLEHGVLQLAAMQARMPHVAVTPAYALLAEDLRKLQSMVDLIAPAVLFVQNGAQFARALRGLQRPANCVLVCVDDPVEGLDMLRWSDWQACTPTAAVDASVAAITPDTVAKYLFTSGSTGLPKAVTITQRMLCTMATMHAQMIDYGANAPAHTVVSWLPWSHVAAGCAQLLNVVTNGGVFYLDDGKPVAGAFDETLKNLREIHVTNFTSVPTGYAMLVDALEADDALAATFFRDLQRMAYAGAKLSDTVAHRLQALAVRHVGHRIPMVSSYGSTETCASVTMLHWCTTEPGIGLPHPGVQLKLVALDEERYEIRVRSAAVTPGYLQAPEQTRAAFDDEGFFLLGDAVRFLHRERPEDGLEFAGRVSEEFKLQTGIFVRVGALRAQAVEAAGGLLNDAVVTGADQAFVGLLAWPNLPACRTRTGAADATLAELVHSSALRDAVRQAFAAHNQRNPTSSQRIRRVLLLTEPPSMAAGEITDKGYVNQRAALQRRADSVARLYATTPDADVIDID